MQFRESDQASIGQIHRQVGVPAHQNRYGLKFRLQIEGELQDTTSKKFPNDLRSLSKICQQVDGLGQDGFTSQERRAQRVQLGSRPGMVLARQ